MVKRTTLQQYLKKMICKFCLGGQNKVARLKQDATLEDVNALVAKYYPSLTTSYELYYLDEEEDQISLTSEDDFQIFRERSQPNLKINIKPIEDHHSENASQIGQRSIIEQLKMSKEASYFNHHKESSPFEKETKREKFLLNSRKKEETHEVSCSKCRCREIIGVRYQCPFCLGYNLCEICERDEDHEHSLLKVKDPRKQLNYAQLFNQLSQQFPNQNMMMKDRQISELRTSYNSLLKLVEQMSQNQSKKDNLLSKLKQEKEKVEKKVNDMYRDTTQFANRAGRYITNTLTSPIPPETYLYRDPYSDPYLDYYDEARSFRRPYSLHPYDYGRY